MQRHDLVRKGEADARTAHGLVRLVEFFLDIRQMLRGDAAAVVGDDDADEAALFLRIDVDGAALLRIFQRIVEHVDEHLPQAVDVAEYRRQHGGFFVNEEFMFAARAFAEHVNRRAQLRQKVDAVHGKRHASALHTRKVEEFLHDAGKALRFADDDTHAALKHRRIRFTGLDRLGPSLNGGQRCAQLVRNGRDEVVLHLLVLAQFVRHAVDGVAQLAKLVVVRLDNARLEIALRD